MKWNSPPVLLMGGTILAVGIMALASRNKTAAISPDCSRILLPATFIEDIERRISDNQMEQIFRDALGASRNYDAAAARVFDRVLAELLPECPSPLPNATILVSGETGEELTVAESKAAFVATVAPFIEIYAEGQDAANAGARTVRHHHLSARVARALV